MQITRKHFELHGENADTAEFADLYLRQIGSIRLKRIKPDLADADNMSVRWKIATLGNSIAFRLYDLGKCTQERLYASDYLAAIILARQFIETVSLLHYIEAKISSFVEQDKIEELEDILLGFTFGARYNYFSLEGISKPINILTMISKLEKEISGVEDIYSKISEITHPNPMGHFSFYCEIDDTRTANFGKLEFNSKLARSTVVFALHQSGYCLKMLEKLRNICQKL